MQIIPDLAESWTISPDGTVYTFVIREGAKFADGKPITAQDVKYSWERAADPETDSSTVETYMGDILGLKEKFNGEADEIAGVKVIDERTLEVTLDGPKPYFLAKLTYPTSFVVDQTNVEADPQEWMFNPNASGPYRVQEIREEDAIILVRNDAYYSPAKIPYVVYLLYRAGTDVSYYQAGEVDIAYLGSSDAKVIRDDPSDPLNDELHVTTTMCMSYIQLSNTLPPFDDPKVREAFTLAVDKDRMNELFGENLAIVANSVLPPAMPGYNQSLPAQAFDPEAARAALEASSYAGNLPTITILEAGYGDTEDPFTTALIDMWKEALEVDIVVQYVDPDDSSTALRAAEGHITSSGWCADYPDPENFLDILFHPDSQFNYIHYDNPEFTALIEEARTELDPARRISLYQQAEALLLQDFGVIPIFHSTSYTLIKPYLKGWVDSAMRVPSYHLLSIEK
ncbi:MAG TPA: peptide ABC transporter substrate-binding protein [Anaerolineales bacterium]|nr:peptide ABC transporter substrate-binding protein [Anaerolineales bacterium]